MIASLFPCFHIWMVHHNEFPIINIILFQPILGFFPVFFEPASHQMANFLRGLYFSINVSNKIFVLFSIIIFALFWIPT